MAVDPEKSERTAQADKELKTTKSRQSRNLCFMSGKSVVTECI